MQLISRKTIFFHLNYDQLFRTDTAICLKMSKKGAQKYWHFFYFSLLPRAAQTTQTEEFMYQNVAYRPTVYTTGV